MRTPTTVRPLRRVKYVTEVRGCGTTQLYGAIKEGLMTPPLKRGRSSLWPEDEIAAINAADIAGASSEEIRRLVRDLVAARTQQAAA